jgi:uncharacterized membrane protein
MTASRAASLLSILVALAGLGVAAYLTSVHYAGVSLACSSSGVVNCEQVITSRYAEVFGIPWSVGGIVWFSVSGLLAAVALTRRPEPEHLQTAQVTWSLIGMATVVYLIGVELVALKHICLWCSVMHVLVALSLLLALFRQPEVEGEAPDLPATTGGSPASTTPESALGEVSRSAGRRRARRSHG